MGIESRVGNCPKEGRTLIQTMTKFPKLIKLRLEHHLEHVEMPKIVFLKQLKTLTNSENYNKNIFFVKLQRATLKYDTKPNLILLVNL